VRHDVGERGLAEARGAAQKQVPDRLRASRRGLEHDREMLLEIRLAHELFQGPRAKRALGLALPHLGLGEKDLLAHAGFTCSLTPV